MGLRPTQGDEKRLLFSNHCPGSTALPLVIPPAPACRGTGAYPDFLLRAASDVHLCGSP
jgi:hypothetical protein